MVPRARGGYVQVQRAVVVAGPWGEAQEFYPVPSATALDPLSTSGIALKAAA